MKNTKGITLIALVITIIVLLILAGVTLNLVTGGDGILGKATNAVNETNKGKISEEIELAMAELKNQYYEEKYVTGEIDATTTFAKYAETELKKTEDSEKIGIETSNGKLYYEGTEIIYENKNGVVEATGTFDTNTGSVEIAEIIIDGIKIPEGLKIGSTVSYTPNGTYTGWTTDHSGYNINYNLATGSSYTGANGQTEMTISSWKVFKTDKKTGNIQLIPTVPTTAKVGLLGVNGYNNGVKLLNDACSSLYGKEGVTARSINIEDIENVINYDPKTYSNNFATYDQQYTTAYTINKNYPNLYASEKRNVIDGTENTGTLGESDAADDWVSGSTTATTSIRPYQTYYYLDDVAFSSKIKPEYLKMLLPNDATTNYWIASRSITIDEECCRFFVRNVFNGYLFAHGLYSSDTGDLSGAEFSLFPILSLNVNQLVGDKTSGFRVE